MLFLSSFLMNAGMTISLRLSSGLFPAENHTGAGGKISETLNLSMMRRRSNLFTRAPK